MTRLFALAVALVAIAASTTLAADPPGGLCQDRDLDGFFNPSGCSTDTDCNDLSASSYPGAPELCDGFDNDCDGSIDEGLACPRLCQDPMLIGEPVRFDLDACEDDSTWVSGLAWGGQGYGIWRRGFGLYFETIDAHGNRTSDTVTLPLTMGPYGWSGRETDVIDAVSMGGAYGVLVVNEIRDTFRFRLELNTLSADGTRIAGVILEEIMSEPTGAIVGNDSGFAVVWQPNYNGEYSSIMFYSQHGQAVVSSSPDARSADLAWNGTEYGVVWTEGADIRFMRLDRSGEALLTQPITVREATGFVWPQIIWIGGEWSVVWSENGDLFFRRVGVDGTMQSVVLPFEAPFLVGLQWTGEYYIAGGAQLDADGRRVVGPVDAPAGAAISWNGTGFGVAWNENGDCHREIYFQRIACCPDADQDGYRACDNDCNDANPTVHPGAVETCNGVDDNCNALIDEDDFGEDSDGDTIPNLCDNCRDVVNVSQADSDDDGIGNACDNCIFVNNVSQSDSDGDSQGDFCDVDDGLIYLFTDDPNYVRWGQEAGFSTWNLYRGALDTLTQDGTYTQAPGSNPLANQECGLSDRFVEDPVVPELGEVAFYLTTGWDGAESDLGRDSANRVRPNSFPCP